eukprot:10689030-Lingulodinium_polyedra.AAC.1
MHWTSSLNALATCEHRLAALSADTFALFSESTQALSCISECVTMPVPDELPEERGANSAVSEFGLLGALRLATA